MPDARELTQELDVGNPSDGPLDHDGDGNTNLEEYLNSLVPSILGIFLSYRGVEQFLRMLFWLGSKSNIERDLARYGQKAKILVKGGTIVSPVINVCG